MPKRKLPLAKRLKRLKTRLWALISQIVRLRDGQCILCGNTETLQAHHWIVHARGSIATQFLPENAVTLCYSCHIFKVHQRGDAFFLDQIKAYMIPKFLDEERYEEIKFLGRGTTKWTEEDYKDRIVWAEEMYANLEIDCGYSVGRF